MKVNVCGIVVARDERLTLPYAINSLHGTDYIAVLDNPTGEVDNITGEAIHKIYAPKQDDQNHIMNWQVILDLIKQAALIARQRGYEWVIRIDADETWYGFDLAIYHAIMNQCNIVNYTIKQWKPNKELVTEFDPGEDQDPCQIGDPLYLAPDGNFYERAWQVDTDNFNLGAGGHQILRADRRVYQSLFDFNHYPAIDWQSFRKKLKRKYNQSEVKQKKWHIQYKGVEL